jgi:hypothetical protein
MFTVATLVRTPSFTGRNARFSNQTVVAHRPLMDQREDWFSQPEGRQRNGILREHRGYDERDEIGLPVASVTAGR